MLSHAYAAAFPCYSGCQLSDEDAMKCEVLLDGTIHLPGKLIGDTIVGSSCCAFHVVALVCE